jgi:hypothetical protein
MACVQIIMSSHFSYAGSMEAQDNYDMFDIDFDRPYRRWFYLGFLVPVLWVYLALKGGIELWKLSRTNISPHAPTAIELHAQKLSCVGSWVTNSVCGLVFYAVCGWTLYMMVMSRW